MTEIHRAVGSFVVDALDGDELSEFETHLAVCETCQREVMEFSETAGHLASLASSPPPPALRGSILSAIQEVRQLPPETAEADAPTPRRAAPPWAEADHDRANLVGVGPGRAGPESTSSPTGAQAGGVVDELAIRRSRRTTRLLAFATAAALVIALGLGGWVANLRQNQPSQVAGVSLEAQLMAAPDLRVITTPMKNGGEASFRVSKSLDKAMFLGVNLPDPGADKKYQLWTIDDQAHASPDGLLDGGATRTAWFSGPVASSSVLAVTIEPSTGSQVPSMKPLAAATL